MTTRPRPNVGSHLFPALAAVALFGVVAAIILTSSFGAPRGFPADANVVASIGRAMFGLGNADVGGESFLVALEITDLVLTAALAGGVLLARREFGGQLATPLPDGGRLLGRDDGAEKEEEEH